MTPAIVPIVEGQAECESVPILLRRILAQILSEYRLQVATPFRVKRNRVVRPGEIERAVELAVRDREGAACLIVLLDADDDCPATLGPALLDRCARATGLPASVVLANREYEAWFLGAKESLRGSRGIRTDATGPPDPEAVRGAKERLARNMRGKPYDSVLDQPALTAKVDLDMASRRCPSFRKLLRDLRRLVEQMRLDRG